jgi:hypothetical protein
MNAYRGKDKDRDKGVFLKRLVNEHLEPLNEGEAAVLFLGKLGFIYDFIKLF